MYFSSAQPMILVLIITLISYIFNTLAPSFLNDLLWKIYTSTPTSLSKRLKELQTLKLEVLRLRNEIKGTSAQDQFAKWAKAKRKHDEKMTRLEKLNQEINSERTRFTAQTRIFRWTITQGAKILATLYYIKTPMFYLPAGFAPGYIEFLLALPKAPKGSVSVQAWAWACGVAVDVVFGLLVVRGGGWVLGKVARKSRKTPQAVPASEESEGHKKEL